MERQLRMGGGIMNVTPRQQYGLGSFIKKAVKGVTKGVKKFAKSDLGKAAIMAGIGFGIPGTTMGGLFGRASFGGAAPGMFGGTGGLSAFFGKGSLNPLLKTSVGDVGQSPFGSMLSGAKNFLKSPLGMGAAITAGSALAAVGIPEDQAPNDLATLQSYLKSGYLKLNPDLDYNNEEDKAVVDNFVQQNSIERMAEGGRIGYGDGSGDMILPMRKPETEKMLTYEEAKARDPQMFVDTTTRGLTRNEPVANLIEKYNTYNKAMPGVADETKTYLMEDFKKSLEDSGISIEEFNMRLQEQNEMDEPVDMAYGGRMSYGDGTDFENYLKGRKQFEKQQSEEQRYREYIEDMRRQKIAEQRSMVAYGGRMGYANGGAGYSFGYKPGKEFQLNVGSMGKGTIKEIINSGELTNEDLKAAINALKDRKAEGGRMGYAFGTDSPENNAIQAAGIEGLPLNQNPAGVTELDLRDSGGFIPPVGVKEKADDIPAMLANNEFVFTADAVRGMGDGSVNKGAQRMYDMMKKLEKGGRV